MLKPIASLVAPIVIIVALCNLSGVSAQAPASSDAAVTALVNEVRALRADLAEASQRTLRFELLLARLQMQEQRLAYLDRQRAEVSGKVFDASRSSEEMSGQMRRLEQGCREGTVPPEMRDDCNGMVEGLKRDLSGRQKREADLRAQEAEVLNQIAAEQSRWTDFSARLDELERVLSRR